MAKHEDLIVGLDIGTTKICAIVGEPTEEGINIIGIGSHPSKGLRKGVVVNIESTVSAIKRAVEEAELMAGCDITAVNASITGSHIKGINSRGIVAIKEKEVRSTDLKRVIDAAQAVAIPVDREVLHVIPQEYIIDNQDGVRDPVGMSGVRLEAKVHIVTAAVSAAQNVIKCCNRAGLNVGEIILAPLATAESVLGQDEKELGVAVVDIGGGTTDVAIFANGSVMHTIVLPLGGNHLTNDVAVGLRTPANEAEKIKQRYGCVLTSLVSREETIEVPSVGGRNPRILSRQILSEILEPRMEEIFNLVRQEISRAGFEDRISAGIVLAGGCAGLEGMPELAEQVFNLPVRRGIPKEVGGLTDVVRNSMYATGVGLVQLAAKSGVTRDKVKGEADSGYSKVKSRMREWLSEIF
ncbi:MAG: cell division protein FtsA [Deltaproteobacteria bacterium CG11_big_fil_rev_8_21_14_0_20_47_16]|nr:MAG: cell division protein FtsA [Deltaproteobacteria bacterium CG11_big_fil_rev_8_21_14_0_20_47_16]